MPLTRQFEYENTEGVIEPGKTKARKKLKFSLNGLGTPPIATTLSGWPAVDSATMSVLAGNPKVCKTITRKSYFFNMVLILCVLFSLGWKIRKVL